MKYDFDKVIDRSGTSCAKYDERLSRFGRADVIPLWVADMDFKTAQPVIDACIKCAESGIWGYTSRPDSFFEAIKHWQERRNGWSPDTSLMSWSLGVVPTLAAILRVFTSPGDGVLIQTPVYSEFYDVPELGDRVVVENPLIETPDGWKLDRHDFEDKLKFVKVFFLCSPHNPLGIVWTREELSYMVEACLKNGVLLVSDEIHSDLVFWGKRHIPTASISENAAKSVITCLSGTKTFNLAGLQASAAVFPNAEMKRRFNKWWGALDIGRGNTFSVFAMEAAFNHGDEWLDQLRTYLEGNLLYIKDFCTKHIPKIKPSLPDATYLVWLDCRELGLTNDELREFMIWKAGLGLNEGNTFGRSLSGFMRLNAACPRSVLEKALTQLKNAVDGM